MDRTRARLDVERPYRMVFHLSRWERLEVERRLGWTERVWTEEKNVSHHLKMVCETLYVNGILGKDFIARWPTLVSPHIHWSINTELGLVVFLVDSLGFSTFQDYVVCRYIFFPVWMLFISFSCLIALERTASTGLNRRGRSMQQHGQT